MTRLLQGLVLLLSGLLASCTPAPESPVDVLITNVTVIDADSAPRPGHRVLINAGRIIAVEPDNPPDASQQPAAREIIDGNGRFLIPGLWDMHVHFLYDSALTESMAELFLRYGVTSVRDTGGNVTQMRVIADQLEQAAYAPRLFYSGPLLDGRFVVYDGGDSGRPELGTAVAETSAAERQVAQLQQAGASFIKIYELVDPEVFAALADAARQKNMPIASHVPLLMTAEEAGPLADSMEHLRNLELACASNWKALLDERTQIISGFTEGRGYELRRQLHALQRLPAIAAYDARRCDQVLSRLTQTLQVPTLRLNTVAMEQPFLRDDWPAALADLPENVQQSWQERAVQIQGAAAETDHTFAEWSLFLIERLQANNVTIAAGTDAPIGLGIPGYSLHTELELLVRSGLSPREALHAATLTAASFFNLQSDIGAIEPGMQADLLLLEANPLEDISNTRTISAVMVNGRWVP